LPGLPGLFLVDKKMALVLLLQRRFQAIFAVDREITSIFSDLEERDQKLS
jgi:hypothetical protein